MASARVADRTSAELAAKVRNLRYTAQFGTERYETGPLETQRKHAVVLAAEKAQLDHPVPGLDTLCRMINSRPIRLLPERAASATADGTVMALFSAVRPC